jgi:Rod binding domain-containing protein
MTDALGSIEPRVNAGQLGLERLASSEHVSEQDKAREVARQFEAVLLRQILQSAHQTGIKGMFEEESSSTKDVYFDMMNFHLADTISQGGGLGLASAFEAQLQRQTSPVDSGSDDPAT